MKNMNMHYQAHVAQSRNKILFVHNRIVCDLKQLRLLRVNSCFLFIRSWKWVAAHVWSIMNHNYYVLVRFYKEIFSCAICWLHCHEINESEFIEIDEMMLGDSTMVTTCLRTPNHWRTNCLMCMGELDIFSSVTKKKYCFL